MSINKSNNGSKTPNNNVPGHVDEPLYFTEFSSNHSVVVPRVWNSSFLGNPHNVKITKNRISRFSNQDTKQEAAKDDIDEQKVTTTKNRISRFSNQDTKQEAAKDGGIDEQNVTTTKNRISRLSNQDTKQEAAKYGSIEGKSRMQAIIEKNQAQTVLKYTRESLKLAKTLHDTQQQFLLMPFIDCHLQEAGDWEGVLNHLGEKESILISEIAHFEKEIQCREPKIHLAATKPNNEPDAAKTREHEGSWYEALDNQEDVDEKKKAAIVIGMGELATATAHEQPRNSFAFSSFCAEGSIYSSDVTVTTGNRSKLVHDVALEEIQVQEQPRNLSDSSSFCAKGSTYSSDDTVIAGKRNKLVHDVALEEIQVQEQPRNSSDSSSFCAKRSTYSSDDTVIAGKRNKLIHDVALKEIEVATFDASNHQTTTKFGLAGRNNVNLGKENQQNPHIILLLDSPDTKQAMTETNETKTMNRSSVNQTSIPDAAAEIPFKGKPRSIINTTLQRQIKVPKLREVNLTQQQKDSDIMRHGTRREVFRFLKAEGSAENQDWSFIAYRNVITLESLTKDVLAAVYFHNNPNFPQVLLNSYVNLHTFQRHNEIYTQNSTDLYKTQLAQLFGVPIHPGMDAFKNKEMCYHHSRDMEKSRGCVSNIPGYPYPGLG